MKILFRRRRCRAGCFLALAALLVAHVPPSGVAQEAARPARPSVPVTMRLALDAAWQRSIDAAESHGRGERAKAHRALYDGWLAAPAALTLSQREALSGGPAGSRELDIGWSMPLWLPGQRAAGEEASQTEQELALAAEQAARLRLAGRLRISVMAVRLAEVELRQSRGNAAALRQLADDVDRRVAAGDLAPADALAARSDLLTAESAVGAAELALIGQRQAWQLLTGFEQLPGPEVAAPAPQEALPEAHPELLLAAKMAQWSRQRVALARARPYAAPELALGVRQQHPGAGADARHSVVIGLRVPLGDQVHRQPGIAEALAEEQVARVQAERLRERLRAEIALAESELRSGQQQLAAEQRRAGLLAERARLIDLSFRAGESSLPAMLLALAARSQAELSAVRKAVAVDLARARLAQALGVLP